MSPQDQFIQSLLETAGKENWKKIDEELIPQLEKMDGDKVSVALLKHVLDDNPNVRDVVASALSGVTIANERIKGKAIKAMINMTDRDPEKFPAGRAASFLLQHQEDLESGPLIRQTLGIFKHRASVEGWTGELRKEIPELEEFLAITINGPDGLTLRQYSTIDAPAIFSLIDTNRDHLSQHGDETAEKYPDEEAVVESIKNPKNPKRLRFGIRNDQGVLVGSINLTPDEGDSKRGEIGYYVGKDFTRRGYPTDAMKALSQYAFTVLGYETVYTKVHPDNIPSRKVSTKAGFTETGFVKKDILYTRNSK